MEKQVSREQMLSPHFSLEEMCKSGTAIRKNIENWPDALAVERLRVLCLNVLEPLRRRFGVIRITSGYRCQSLNEAVGGVPTSQHLLGEAADIHVSNREVGQKMFDFIDKNLVFDQLLFEQRQSSGACWLHVSYRLRRAANRHQAIPYHKVK
ncbi:MAG: D-Ala-D-Ala carboxypeptidase family metallohydrolase [Prevotellaceae bacterium]|nr:D-Ala-D-Ala carboxypeptidase family metallohydrolase [Prevotella sp.]MDD7258519.1 D-Ala-D-Ala carboxypeptidase family metallohydrolase [Prevotellaceae bacterium]MDY6131536.1 D-Ala-D-Ala carboxypeptidase family metallohydrolase [Prevotella sp.]